tara:strand:- start:130 stop:369 length:240 start_codon:yes stop_codon:yes gene_type:complete
MIKHNITRKENTATRYKIENQDGISLSILILISEEYIFIGNGLGDSELVFEELPAELPLWTAGMRDEIRLTVESHFLID